MVEFETFLRCAGGEFRKVEDCNTPPLDPDYIEGAIRLLVDGIEIIGFGEWDYVDQLWCYISEMMRQLRGSSHYAETYFPDQPVKLAFEVKGKRVLVTAKIGEEVRKASASSVDFFDSLKVAGLIFFGRISELVPANSYAEEQQELSI
ncbi:hypothetical protein C8D87_10272 [Lentzea atacamensis]|uniref:Uncharacterized protein n=1 Tax=Lentzea atacamensis TaxID=531938 RepID=A0ABX9EBL4_9PSEU|nr:hypothetical protein [Lentzea atacamensis]RAS68012.1 hypothetical protein C8D87_10272 [Lentzea atacamensis]